MTSFYYLTDTTTAGPSFSKTIIDPSERRNLTVEFYSNGSLVKISGLRSNDEVADLMKKINTSQVEVTY